MTIKKHKQLVNKIFRVQYLVVLLSVLYLCTPRNFPVIHPVNEAFPEDITKIKAQEHFIRARDYERRDLMQSAERHYEMASALDPKSSVLQAELVRIYLQNGKYSQALLSIKKDRKNEDLSRDEKRTVATIYLKMGEFEKAVELLESISDKTEDDVYSLGLIYESLGNITKALQNYTVYYEKNPDAMQMGFKIGKLYLGEKKFSQAESLFLAMKSDYSNNVDVYTQLGIVRVIQGDTSGGIAFFDSALVIDSTHEEALRSKAQIFINRNMYTEAVSCYEKLFSISSYGEVYGRTLALLYYYNKQYNTAEDLLKTLLQQSMDDYELHYYLGLVFSASGKNDFARIELEKALSIRSEFDEAWRELCYVAIRENKLDEALAIADRYTTIFSQSAPAWRLKGYICSLQKNYVLAIDALKQATLLDTTDAHIWFELGSALERNGNIDEAANAFRVVLKSIPNDAATLNYLGYMWAEKGINLDSASKLLQLALEQDNDNGAFLDSYSWIFYQQGNLDSAEVYIRKALMRISDDPVIYAHLGEILAKKNDFIGAVEAFRKSLEFNPDDPDAIRSKIMEIELLIRKDVQ